MPIPENRPLFWKLEGFSNETTERIKYTIENHRKKVFGRPSANSVNPMIKIERIAKNMGGNVTLSKLENNDKHRRSKQNIKSQKFLRGILLIPLYNVSTPRITEVIIK